MTCSRAPTGSRWRPLLRLGAADLDLSEDVFPEAQAEPAAEEDPCERVAEAEVAPPRPASRAADDAEASVEPSADAAERRRGEHRSAAADDAEASIEADAVDPAPGARRFRGSRPVRPERLSSPGPRPLAVAITGGIGAGRARRWPRSRATARRRSRATRSSTSSTRIRTCRRRWPSASARSDRQAVSEQAVGDRDALIWLEQLLHPRVIDTHRGLARRAGAAPESAGPRRERGPAPLRGREPRPLRRGRRDHRAARAAGRAGRRPRWTSANSG